MRLIYTQGHMSISIECLRQKDQRPLSGESLSEQKRALQGLVSAMREHIVQHGVDVELIKGVPREARRYAAYFKIPGEDAVLAINSNGPVENEKDFGLTLSLSTRDENILRFQTPNTRKLVSDKDALYLSGYTVKDLVDLTTLVQTGEPITPAAYKAFFGRK